MCAEGTMEEYTDVMKPRSCLESPKQLMGGSIKNQSFIVFVHSTDYTATEWRVVVDVDEQEADDDVDFGGIETETDGLQVLNIL